MIAAEQLVRLRQTCEPCRALGARNGSVRRERLTSSEQRLVPLARGRIDPGFGDDDRMCHPGVLLGQEALHVVAGSTEPMPVR